MSCVWVYCYCNELLRNWCLKTTKNYYLTVLDVRSKIGTLGKNQDVGRATFCSGSSRGRILVPVLCSLQRLHSLTLCLVYKVSSGKLSLFNITSLWPGLFYLSLPHCRTLWPTKVIQDNLSILNSIKFISNFTSNCKINPHLPCQYMCSLHPRFICSNSNPQCDVVRRGGPLGGNYIMRVKTSCMGFVPF